MRYRTANREDGARLDVVAQGLWGKDRQCTFFDMRVINPFAQSHQKDLIDPMLPSPRTGKTQAL
jgi:hypothetical protein